MYTHSRYQMKSYFIKCSWQCRIILLDAINFPWPTTLHPTLGKKKHTNYFRLENQNFSPCCINLYVLQRFNTFHSTRLNFNVVFHRGLFFFILWFIRITNTIVLMSFHGACEFWMLDTVLKYLLWMGNVWDIQTTIKYI